jgi:putative two-component system response regulator
MADNATILIVDDEPSICKLLCDILEPEGYACKTAPSADIALKLLSKYTIDLALLDIKIPGMSGIDLLELMTKSYTSIPVIICTAVIDINTAVDAITMGAADYILKPFTIDDVVSRVAVAYRRKLSSTLNGNQSPLNDKSSPDRLDAIARGVDALVGHYDFHDRIVIERTVEVARSMDIPQADIDVWIAARRERSSSLAKKIGVESDLYEKPSGGTVVTTTPGV